MASIVKRGSRWQVKVRRRGYPPISSTFAIKADAEAYGRKVEREMDMGHWRDLGDAERITVRELIEQYRDKVASQRKSPDKVVARLNVLQDAKFARHAVAKLRAADLAKYRDERLEAGAAANTIRNDLNTLSAVIEWGRADLSLPVDNPARVVKKPSPAKGRSRRLSPDEEERLLAAAEKSRCAHLKPLIVLALETGMRLGELCSFRASDIDFKRRILMIHDSKNGESRAVPLSSRAIKTLHAWETPSLHGGYFGAVSRNVTVLFRDLTKRAGIEDLRFHDLRHEALSRLAERGDLSVLELASISGHKTLQMLKRYTHLQAEDLAKKIR